MPQITLITQIFWWCPKYVDELFTNLDSAGLSQKDINTFMTLPIFSISVIF
ncbi:hypothetical protein MTBBW1_1220009 [Desulfamplus magnetovallimortis]|uniref:Uncharacterized protein n=1 Tax=Desulfamplus magnetovallimortis TaxID=1246637 RepID=A0A1W1H6A9_9BACT|nr:hypothetical protein MTBBW1_1220009 [Desulfamplus magnetovallimortis]